MGRNSYLWKAFAVGFAALLLTELYQVIKTALWPGITVQQSHMLTVLFCAVVCLALAAAILRNNQLRLKESERLFSSLMDTFPGVAVIFDNSGTIRRTNRNFLGYEPDEMAGEPIAKCIAPESLAAVQEAIRRFFESGPQQTEALMLAQDGARVPCILTGGFVEFEGTPCILGICIDITWRKRAEAELRLRTAALESAANAIIITDTHGTIQWVNPAFTKLTGYRAQEAIGQNPRMLKSGKQDRSVYKKLWNTVLAGKVWQGEITNRRKDGELYREEMTISPVVSEAGEVTHYVAVKLDITERKRIESALRESEQLFRELAENTPAVFFVYEFDPPRAKYVSPAFEKTWGRSREELYRDPNVWMEGVLAEDRQQVGELYERGLRGVPGEIEYRVVRPDGSIRHVRSRALPVCDATGRCVRLTGLAEDVTEQRLAEESLRDSESKVRLLLDSTAEAIFTMDPQGVCTLCNAARDA